MSTLGRLQTLSRAVAFGRHMPANKLARRIELTVRRKLRDRLGVGASTPTTVPALADHLPQPIFASRTGHVRPSGAGLAFTFLNRTIQMPGAGIDWSQPGNSPREQLWRMNLHYMEYLEELDESRAAAAVVSWIETNPAGQPGAWRDSWNSYALSLRVVVWMQQLAVRGAAWPEAAKSAAMRSLSSQIAFLERNLETDLGGNHLIKNIKALIWASAFFKGEDAERWRTLGLKLLGSELAAQILPDGMHYERSPSYHAQVAADLLECRHALGGDLLAGRLDAALARMAQVLADLTHPDGAPALFNDAGRMMAYAPGECLAVYERLFGSRPQARAVFALRDAGYFGLHSDGLALLADCGRIAPDDLPAHGHGDVLSFEWSVGGKRIVVDQGVFEYHAGDRRQASRGAANHNTLCIDGQDQADFFGAFRCGRRPNVIVRRFESGASGFILEGSHDGFAHLPGAPVHVRRFEATAGGVTIRDRIEGQSARPASITFLLHPDVAATIEGREARLRCGGACVTVAASQPIRMEDAVWWPDMGRELSTRRLRIAVPSGMTELETKFTVSAEVS